MTVWLLILAMCADPFKCDILVWTDSVVQIETHMRVGKRTSIHCIYINHQNGSVKTTKHTRGRCNG